VTAAGAVLTELGRIANGNTILIPEGPPASTGTSVARLLSYFAIESNFSSRSVPARSP
jgi:hypothetical protein